VPALLPRVKTTLSIVAHRRVRGWLDGEYRSVFHGKSHDFDDLRPYVPGDEIRDIDWKATARHGAPLTKRYIASRKQAVMIVVDSGRDLAAVSASGEPKRDLAIQAAGVLGYLAHRHGDQVGLVTGDAAGSALVPLGGTEGHLERLLQIIHARASLQGSPSDFAGQLDYVARRFRRRMLLVIISDDQALAGTGDDASGTNGSSGANARPPRTPGATASDLRPLLRRLHAQHEMLWVSIADADLVAATPRGAELLDVQTFGELPEFLRRDPQVRREYTERATAQKTETRDILDRIGIASTRIESTRDVVPKLFRLLERHNHAGR
jgi:uncharacterized protein (DUF58 family)